MMLNGKGKVKDSKSREKITSIEKDLINKVIHKELRNMQPERRRQTG